MKVSDYVASFLAEQGVRHVFELVGGMITHLVDSVHCQGKTQLVSMHHEQAAAFAADAMGRLSGVPGVAMATSGPGATNLLTGIGSCYYDSSPAVFITGQVNRNEQKGSRPIRQLGFQETDIVAMAQHITKAAWRVQSAEEVPTILTDAFRTALSGRPGPVLIDIPMDVQREQIAAAVPPRLAVPSTGAEDRGAIEELFVALRSAKRPMILAGGGIHAARAVGEFRSLAEEMKLPVVSSLMAVDVLPFGHPLRVGMIGSYGNRWANMALGHSDFLLVLGSRLDIRQTGSETDAFKANRTIYQVDCDAAEMNNRVTGCRLILADLRSFLSAASTAEQRPFPDRSEWLAEIYDWRSAWPDTDELAAISGINPNQFMHELAGLSTPAATFVADVGQHQMWAAQSLELGPSQRFLTSGGMGAMGFGLPAAIGAALSTAPRPVVLIAGDGGFQLNIQELQTVVRNRLPIKIVLLNNQCHGMVRQFQQTYFGERYQSTYWGYSAPDFARVAEAYGIAARTVSDPCQNHAALQAMWRDPAVPHLLQVMIDPLANVYPKIAFGHPLTEMEPFVQPVAMEGT